MTTTYPSLVPHWKAKHAITCHKDGTASFWHVPRAEWCRTSAGKISDEALAAMPQDDRDRISDHAAGQPVRRIRR